MWIVHWGFYLSLSSWEFPAGMAGLPHSSSHPPGRHLAPLNPGRSPAQTGLSAIDKMWFQALLLVSPAAAPSTGWVFKDRTR